jgi:hypothetical protein
MYEFCRLDATLLQSIARWGENDCNPAGAACTLLVGVRHTFLAVSYVLNIMLNIIKPAIGVSAPS